MMDEEGGPVGRRIGAMMKDRIVRLQSLRLRNIKNVLNGKIEMPNARKNVIDHSQSEVLGLYGQNGSGKTAVIDALYFMQQVMLGREMDKELGDYVNVSEKQAEITAQFVIFMKEAVFDVDYRIKFQRGGKGIVILRETLSSAKTAGGKRNNKTVFMDYRRNTQEIFLPQKNLEELLSVNKEYKTDLIVARKISEKSNVSYIFGETSREIFLEDYSNDFHDYSEIIRSLFHFAVADLFVIRNVHSGVISANMVLPMAFRIDESDGGMKGEFTISLTEPTILNEEEKNVLYRIIEEINTVIGTIIPGMQIEIWNYGMQLLDDGNHGDKVELLSKKAGSVSIPIRMESNGIIKIISILNAMIQAFGNESICLAVDELDAGIFEYMLGEILAVFDESAKGQLIFTSHNLRALEMLGTESIMFSTANPENRYIHMRNIKKTNNCRDVYLRSITLGGQSEIIYDATDSLKIARAFRKAGRSIRNGRG